jgi:ElaB/YqjD/DUF883 family membrane-anchored ribosome-binding protein
VSDELLDKADALMRRRNVAPASKVENSATTSTVTAVASSTPTPLPPSQPTSISLTPSTKDRDEVEPLAGLSADLADDDFPVLTEIVDASDVLPHSADIAAQIEATVRERLDLLLKERQANLSQEIEAWLNEQMPQLVIRAMDGITDHLVALLSNLVRDELLHRLEEAPLPSDKTRPAGQE